MKPSASLDYRLLLDYLSGDCTPDQRAQVEGWVAGSPLRSKFFKMLAQLWTYTHRRPKPKMDVDALVRHLQEHVASGAHMRASKQRGVDALGDTRPFSGTNSLKRQVGKLYSGQQILRRITPYIAVSLIIGVLGLLLGRYTQSSRRVAPQDTAPILYSTGKGQRANITLSDGSTVVLSVDSRLEVPADYSRGNRTLWLTGEALFSVRHRPKSAFTVWSGGVTTRVLGTSFLVRHYPSDTATVVAVRDGKVGVHALVLSAGQQSDVMVRGATPVHAADPAQFTFATGVLTLEDMPLQDAIVELSRWYDLDIRLGDPALATRKVWGGFGAGAQSDMIAIFEGGMNLRVVRNGRTITLFPRSSL